MKMRSSLLLAIGICMAWAAVANADTVYLRYVNDAPTETGTFRPNPFLPTYDNFYIGRSNFVELESLNGPETGVKMAAYCIDVNTLIWPGHNYEFDRRELEAVDATRLPLVVAHADDLRRLFALAAPGSSDTADKCAAFAAAVWEVVNETSGNYNLSTGDFKVFRNSGGDWIGLANGWLTTLNNDRATLRLGNVFALYSPSTQSFAFTDGGSRPPVPEPVTMLTAFMAISGIGVYLRKRVRPTV